LAVLTLDKPTLDKIGYAKGDSDGLVNQGLAVKGVEVSAFFREEAAGVKISFRSKGSRDVNAFSREYFAGGGHVNAAGGFFAGSLQEALVLLKKVSTGWLAALLLSAGLMGCTGREAGETRMDQTSASADTRLDPEAELIQQHRDQLAAERKKVEQQLMAAKEEARSASARLSTLQVDFDSQQTRVAELDGQLEGIRASHQESEATRQTAENELSEARGEVEALKSQLEDRSREADEVRSQLEQAQIDLDSARTQVTSQATSFADEISGLRQRLADAEEASNQAQQKVQRAQGRVKAQSEQLDRLRTSLQQAMDTLGEQPADEIEIDELAEA
jgi:predicted  nucleic acid-binding Zn-ribbon protein